MKTLKCEFCGKEFRSDTYFVRDSVTWGQFIYYNVTYCSADCAKEALDICEIQNAVCHRCEQPLGGHIFKASDGNLYCSLKCAFKSEGVSKITRDTVIIE